jgi:hypothetical protein
MQSEYAVSHSAVAYNNAGGSSSNRVDAADAAWAQEGGERSAWNNTKGGASSARKFDIDDDDDNLHHSHPSFAFNANDS